MRKQKADSLVQPASEAAYGFGRLAFGAGLIAAPDKMAMLLMDRRARKTAARTFARGYGSRDTVLGVGMLGAIATGSDTRPWLVAGIMADVLDVALQVGEWDDLPPRKRLPGILSAAAAAAVGVALLARHD